MPVRSHSVYEEFPDVTGIPRFKCPDFVVVHCGVLEGLHRGTGS